MTHVGDLDFDSPLVVKGSEPSKPTFPPESIIMVTSMGFTEIQAQNALEGKSVKLSYIIYGIYVRSKITDTFGTFGFSRRAIYVVSKISAHKAFPGWNCM